MKYTRVFTVSGQMIDFEAMREGECLTTKQLYQALEQTERIGYEPDPEEHDYMTDWLASGGTADASLEECVAIKNLALEYTTDSTERARVPVYDFGRDAERRHFQRRKYIHSVSPLKTIAFIKRFNRS